MAIGTATNMQSDRERPGKQNGNNEQTNIHKK